MKLMIASDIHGSAFYCRQFIQAMERENPDRILLLGDLLYHGPRNPLPKEYDPKVVARMLNGIQEKMVCVRGNCDSEVDQMMLEFPILSDSALLSIDDTVIYATHGHHEFPPLQKGTVVLSGHTHIPCEKEENGIRYLNPGSVSIPKEDSHHGYMILENGEFLWKDLAGELKTIL